MLRVSAASAPMSAASAHRSRRANQNADTDSSRNGDSVYGREEEERRGEDRDQQDVVRAAIVRDSPPAA